MIDATMYRNLNHTVPSDRSHLREITRVGRSKDTESRVVAAEVEGQQGRRDGEGSLPESEVLFCGDEMF